MVAGEPGSVDGASSASSVSPGAGPSASSRRWVRVALFIESVIFPLWFLALAADTAWKFVTPLPRPQLGQETAAGVIRVVFGLLTHPERLPPTASQMKFYTLLGMILVRPALIILFNLMCAVFIAFRSRLRYKPSSVREVLIPFAASTVFLLIPISHYLPRRLVTPIPYPPAWMLSVITAGTALGIAGSLVAVLGIIYLRRNFSVFVEVRSVVTGGLYRFIRHPMYLGEIIAAAGIVIILASAFTVTLLVFLVVFQTLRARMEERRLAEASPEYAALMARTGMFFPKRAAIRR
jgi:protein-S-isoprenylcysteine O-methyltransferase Ste14